MDTPLAGPHWINACAGIAATGSGGRLHVSPWKSMSTSHA